MTTKSRWRKAQSNEVGYHQQIGNDKLHWFKREDRFDIVPEEYFNENKKVLEVGCGSTGVTYSISEHYDEVDTIVGIDPILGKISNEKLSKEPIIQAAGESIPFRSNVFDVVVSINVLDHAISPGQILGEIARVLKPDGTFLFMVNTYDLPEYLRKKLNYVDRPHPHHFSTRDVRTLLHNQGFEIRREVIDSRDLLSKDLDQWSLKWLAASLVFRIETPYLTCALNNR